MWAAHVSGSQTVAPDIKVNFVKKLRPRNSYVTIFLHGMFQLLCFCLWALLSSILVFEHTELQQWHNICNNVFQHTVQKLQEGMRVNCR